MERKAAPTPTTAAEDAATGSGTGGATEGRAAGWEAEWEAVRRPGLSEERPPPPPLPPLNKAAALGPKIPGGVMGGGLLRVAHSSRVPLFAAFVPRNDPPLPAGCF